VRPRQHVGARVGAAAPTAAGSGASPGSAETITGSFRNGAPAGHRGELLGELAVGQVQRAALDQAERGRVPEGGRAAVAERDLIALGCAEQLCAVPARISPTSAFTGFCRCEVPITAPPSLVRRASACSGTFEGPQPKRPSAGLSSRG
jgi:hypothetical protein